MNKYQILKNLYEIVLRMYFDKMRTLNTQRNRKFDSLQQEFERVSREREWNLKRGRTINEYNEALKRIRKEQENLFKSVEIDFLKIREDFIKKIYETKNKFKMKHGIFIGIGVLTVFVISLIIKFYKQRKKEIEAKEEEMRKNKKLEDDKEKMRWNN